MFVALVTHTGECVQFSPLLENETLSHCETPCKSKFSPWLAGSLPPTRVALGKPQRGNPTHELESLVALQRESIHQVAGLVGALRQHLAQAGPAQQRHCRRNTRPGLQGSPAAGPAPAQLLPDPWALVIHVKY